jgi:Fe-S cluster biogenesis protein NfuA
MKKSVMFQKGTQRISGHKIEAIQVNLRGVCKACSGKSLSLKRSEGSKSHARKAG